MDMSASRLRRRGPAPSTKRLAAIAVAWLAAVAAAVIAILVWSSSLLRHNTELAIRDTQSLIIASKVEVSLLTYHRMSNLAALAEDDALEAERREILHDTRVQLREAGRYVSDPAEAEILSLLADDVEEYVDARARFEARGLDFAEMVRRSQVVLARALTRLDALRELNEAQVAAAHDQARWVDQVVNIAAATAGTLLACKALVILLGVARWIVRPLLDVYRAVSLFRAGEMSVRAQPSGPSETRELAHAFNEMADAIATQRRSQLEFLTSVAHDLRNPLSAMSLCIQGLALDASESRRERSLRVLERQLRHLSRMVDDLLDAARIESGQFRLRLSELDVRDVCRHVVTLYEPTATRHRIVLEVPPQVVVLRADPQRLEQVVANLLSNAIKYSPAGGEIRVSVAGTPKGASIVIEDPGIGIAAEDLPKLFVPFRRRRKDVTSGLGLGLSIVRRIVHAHGGDIEVASRPGQGSTFTVRLPRTPPSQRARASEPAPSDEGVLATATAP